jgi:hypothetical protein
MRSRLKTLALAAVVTTVALVPLFGDPRQTPVTHPLWARLLLRALDMTDAVRASSQASQVFSTLSWRDSLSYPADRYLQAEDALVRDENGQRVVTAGTAPAEVVYAVAVVQPGDYQLRARLAGPPAPPATAEILPFAGGGTLKAFTFAPRAPQPGWVLGGAVHLDPGSYRAQFLLPPGCSLAQIEVAPPCINPIEPPGGWKPTGVTTTDDLAVTALKALDAEHDLAPAAEPLEKTGADFLVEWPDSLAAARAAAPPGDLSAMRLVAGIDGLRALVTIDAPEPGLYVVEGHVTPGRGQRWLLDGCRKAMVCPGESAGWRPVLSQVLSRGRHTLVVTLAEGASLDVVRVERKKDEPTDYVAALRRLGFDPGPEGPVSRATALEAARFVRGKHRERLASTCGDTVPRFAGLEPRIAQQPAGAPPVVPPATLPPGPPIGPPIGPPVLPPQPPATPTLPSGGL